MAADSRCGGDTFHCNVSKLARAKDGAILGYTGRAFDQAGFVKWYEGGGELDVSSDFEGLVLRPDGSILCVDEKGRSFVHGAPAAIGSGTRYAYGAMDAGLDAQRAVEIACERDAFSTGPVTTLAPQAGLKLANG